jgi:hypothetical protein
VIWTAVVRKLRVGYERSVDPNFKDDPALIDEDETGADDEEAETNIARAADQSDNPRSP